MRTQGNAQHSVDDDSESFSEFDLHLFHEGTHYKLYEKLGAHLAHEGGTPGVVFSVWAPNAQRVFVAGDFNGWSDSANPLSQIGQHGIWSGFIPDVNPGAAYQFHINSWHHGYKVQKTDPFAFRLEGAPRHAAFVWPLDYEWRDQEWMSSRASCNRVDAPISIYEVHLGSWMRVPEEANRWLSFREIAPRLADHVARTGFTHVQFLPVMEHPLHGPTDFEITGFFAAASRFGAPQDLMFLIDTLHQRGIGVILDWVSSSFAAGESGLAYFDGTHLFERGGWPVALGRQGQAHRFDFSRREVRSFVGSSALFWLDKYHVDGLKLNSTSSVLLLDCGHKSGEWIPNAQGGRENPDGIEFLRQLNAEIQRAFPDALRIAQEETHWPMTTRPASTGGLGFDLNWDSGFSASMLEYFGKEHAARKYHHARLTEQVHQAFEENLLLGFSHVAAGHGRGSFLARMAGDEWQRFANLRLMIGLQYLRPGKKLLFMGTEFAQWDDWKRAASLDWHLLAYPYHSGMQLWVGDLNKAYRETPALQADSIEDGFEWIDPNDMERSTLSWLRRDSQRRDVLLVACNCTPAVLRNVHLGVRRAGHWREVLNSDARHYGGSGQGNFGGVTTSPFPSQRFDLTLSITIPPLGVVVFKHEG